MSAPVSNTNILYDKNKNINFHLPLMSKKLNKIQKYRQKFDLSPSKQASRNKLEKMQNIRNNTFIDNSRTIQQNQISTLKHQKSEQRLEFLSRLQKQYSILKHKIQTSRSKYYKQTRPKYHNEYEISSQQIQKQIKSAFVNQNGKKYYADLYLLKKGRQKLLQQISQTNHTKQSSPQDFLQKNQTQFIKNKIIESRQKKKYKMIKGRNLHWNVYYDMLALSNAQRNKLKPYCKFGQTYDIY